MCNRQRHAIVRVNINPADLDSRHPRTYTHPLPYRYQTSDNDGPHTAYLALRLGSSPLEPADCVTLVCIVDQRCLWTNPDVPLSMAEWSSPSMWWSRTPTTTSFGVSGWCACRSLLGCVLF